MVDIAFGPEPGRRPDPSSTPRRLSGDGPPQAAVWRHPAGAVHRAAWPRASASPKSAMPADFWYGLPHVWATFPAEVLSEAWTEPRQPARPDVAVSALADRDPEHRRRRHADRRADAAGFLSLLSTRGLARWPRLTPAVSPHDGRAARHSRCRHRAGADLHSGRRPGARRASPSRCTPAGALGKLFSEVAENADLKPVEGLTSVGADLGPADVAGRHPAGRAELAVLRADAVRDQRPRLGHPGLRRAGRHRP